MKQLDHCIVCNSKNKRLLLLSSDSDGLYNNNFEIRKCNECGFVWTSPQPDEKEMQKSYFSRYYVENIPYITSFFSKVFINGRIKKIETFKSSGRILDFGCGDGEFLQRLDKRKWEAIGTDFSESALKRIKSKKINFRFIKCEVNKLNLGDNFDVISLWGVFEHISSPHKVLKSFRKMLKKDGLLFLCIPNIESYEAKLSGRKWFHLDPPRHLFHYSPNTIKKLLEMENYNIIKSDNFYIEWSLFGMIQTLFNMLGCEYNFLYNLAKRRYLRPCKSKSKGLYSWILTFTLIPILVPLSIILSLVEALFNRGGIINIYAGPQS